MPDYPDGYLLSFVATDTLGHETHLNRGNYGVANDSEGPVVDITSPADGAILSFAQDGIVDVRGTVTDENPDHYFVHIYGPDGDVYKETVNSNVSITDQSLFSWDLSGAVSGEYTIDLEARDSLDQKDADSTKVIHVIVDNTAPSVPEIIAPADEQTFSDTPILDDWIDSVDNNGIDHYQIEYVYDDGHTFSGGPYRETVSDESSRNHSPALTEQGGVTIRVRAYDIAGNASEWSEPVHYYYGEGDHLDTSRKSLTFTATALNVGSGSHESRGNSNGDQNNNLGGEVLGASTINPLFLDPELLAASSKQDLLNFIAQLQEAVKQLQQMLSNLHQK
jgi:hypothetical protein